MSIVLSNMSSPVSSQHMPTGTVDTGQKFEGHVQGETVLSQDLAVWKFFFLGLVPDPGKLIANEGRRNFLNLRIMVVLRCRKKSHVNPLLKGVAADKKR